MKLDQFPNLAHSTAGWCTASLGRKQKAGSGMGDVTELLPLVLLLTEISVRWCLSLRITMVLSLFLRKPIVLGTYICH